MYKEERVIIFNDIVNCWDYIASVVDEWYKSTEHWWNNSDNGKRRYWEKNLVWARTRASVAQDGQLTDS